MLHCLLIVVFFWASGEIVPEYSRTPLAASRALCPVIVFHSVAKVLLVAKLMLESLHKLLSWYI